MSGELISYADLVALLRAVFGHNGCSEAVAAVLAENCAMGERDGSLSHGIFRVDGYLSSLASGWVDGHAEPVVEDASPAFCRADARNGFAQPALAAARPLLVEKARHNGVAVLAIRNSHHFGALWPDIEPFAREGLIALSVVNSFACSVPYGAQSPVFGTNPIAFAAPRTGADPIVFDMATSSMANGDVQIAAREGRQLPPGSGVDSQGRPTTDPNAVLNGGALVPFGGHKGSALSMMIELLGAALTGGKFSFEVDWSEHKGAQTPHTGQLLIVFDPAFGGGLPFADRANDLVARMREAGLTRLPAERRYRHRREAETTGIPIAPTALARLRALAG
ncbi:MAG TPA: Ldh family oxidoreductase [Devosiaceae bacterium]